MWALVINFVIIPLLFIGYLLTIASSIPGEIKVGFCVAALSAGMPFAPLLARLAKADVRTATNLLVVLTLATIIALPLGLPLAIDAVDAQLKTSAWDVAWPLLLFLLLPLVLGCGFRVWRPDLTPPLTRWVVRVAILCLLFNLNFTLVAYWDLFTQTWGTESYIAAVAGPFIGLGCGYLLVSSLRVKDVAIRHAAEATTAVRNISPMLLMMIYSLCRRPAGHGVYHDPQHHRHRDRFTIRPDVEARCFTIGHPRNNQPASKRSPAPANFDVTSDPPVAPSARSGPGCRSRIEADAAAPGRRTRLSSWTKSRSGESDAVDLDVDRRGRSRDTPRRDTGRAMSQENVEIVRDMLDAFTLMTSKRPPLSMRRAARLSSPRDARQSRVGLPGAPGRTNGSRVELARASPPRSRPSVSTPPSLRGESSAETAPCKASVPK